MVRICLYSIAVVRALTSQRRHPITAAPCIGRSCSKCQSRAACREVWSCGADLLRTRLTFPDKVGDYVVVYGGPLRDAPPFQEMTFGSSAGAKKTSQAFHCLDGGRTKQAWYVKMYVSRPVARAHPRSVLRGRYTPSTVTRSAVPPRCLSLP